MSTLNESKRKVTAIRGMGAAMVGFAGWIILYIVFGLIEPNIFKSNNMLNLLRSMAKYLLVGVGQGVILITAENNVIRFVPPLIIGKEHVDEMVKALKEAIEENL